MDAIAITDATFEKIGGSVTSTAQGGSRALALLLGELWHVAEPDKLAKAALRHVGNEKAMRSELSAAVTAWFRGLELPQAPEPLSAAEVDFIVSLATLAVRARSSVERDYRTREIDFVPDSEAPGRLARCLAQLLGGAKAIGIQESEHRQLVRKVALDCVPALRLRALEILAKDGGEVSTSSVAESIGHPTATVRRSLEDLNAHSLLERRKNGAGKADLWSLSAWAAKSWNDIQ